MSLKGDANSLLAHMSSIDFQRELITVDLAAD